jgi:hypothetical protein
MDPAGTGSGTQEGRKEGKKDLRSGSSTLLPKLQDYTKNFRDVNKE